MEAPREWRAHRRDKRLGRPGPGKPGIEGSREPGEGHGQWSKTYSTTGARAFVNDL